MALTYILALALAAAGRGDRVPDWIDLVAGTRLEGRIVYEDEAHLVLRTGLGDKHIEKEEVKSVRSRARLQRAAFEQWLAVLEPVSVTSALDLARSCRRTDLLEDAQIFAWVALLLDPANADAHALLEHRQRGSVWEARDPRDRWIPVERLLTSRSEWDEAWELSTSHYRVRTNLDLRRAVETALDLECFYRAFYDLFGAELELYEIVEPMNALLHADERSFPELATGRSAYTDVNGIQIDASHGLDVESIFHEATHGILDTTARSSRAGPGTVPGWLGEGLAEYMRAGMIGPPGRRTFVPGALVPSHFATHAAAKAPYDLGRVVRFSPGDFLASSRSDLKYAQAYTLVHFCLHGERDRLRARFLSFLGATLRGPSSGIDFKKAMGLGEAELEKAWTAYVRDSAR